MTVTTPNTGGGGGNRIKLAIKFCVFWSKVNISLFCRILFHREIFP